MKKLKTEVMIGFRVTKEFKKKVDIAAIKEGRTVQSMITRAIEQYLSNK